MLFLFAGVVLSLFFFGRSMLCSAASIKTTSHSICSPANLFFPGKYKVADEMNEEWHLHVFDLNRLKELLRNKLVIEKVKYLPFVFLPLRYIVKCKKI